MKTNVLIFPAGEINSIELHDALSHNVNINVFGASSIDRHGPFVFKNYRGNLAKINERKFIEEFNQLIKEWNIDFIFPTHDDVSLFLAANKDKIDAKIITSSYDTAQICRDKLKTYEKFKNYPFCPNVFASLEIPCFIKPRKGQGSKGALLVNSTADVPEDLDLAEYVICENLPGEELTVDCLTDNNGLLKAVLPRNRKRIMAGVSVAGETIVCDEEIRFIAETINSELDFLGLWYFQIKKDFNGKYKLLEISNRCAGTMCLSRARGVNLPLLSVYAAQGYDLSVFDNNVPIKVDRTLISRYKFDYVYDTVYIDYDDTVIEGKKVSLPVIRFIYQCKNQGKKLVLITRHEADHADTIEDSLKKHCIDQNLFDAIIKLTFEQSKADVIESKKSIFIDNAYSERKKVHDECNIPVFDIEGIEVLLDWTC